MQTVLDALIFIFYLLPRQDEGYCDGLLGSHRCNKKPRYRKDDRAMRPIYDALKIVCRA